MLVDVEVDVEVVDKVDVDEKVLVVDDDVVE